MKKISWLLLSIVILLLLVFASALIPRAWQKSERPLFPEYEADQVEAIILDQGRLLLDQGTWMVEDPQGNPWPARRVQELLQLPVSLLDRPLNRRNEIPSFWQNLDHGTIQWQPMGPSLEWAGDSRRDYILQGGEIFPVSGPPIQDDWLYYLDLQPLAGLEPQKMILFGLTPYLSGQGAESFLYQLVLTQEGWILEPGAEPVEESLMLTHFSTLFSMEAYSIQRAAQMEFPELRFSIFLADNSNKTWTLEVGNPLDTPEGQLWPVRISGSPYIYLFDQTELQQAAKPRDNFQ